MRTTSRRVAAVLGIAVLAVAACGETQSENDQEAEATDQEEEATEDDGVSAADGDDVDADADPEWEEVLERARSEGVVRMYAAMLPGTIDNVAEGFSEKYPDIQIEIDRIVGSEIDSILEAERDTETEGADIVSHVNYSWALDNLDDLVEPVGPHATSSDWVDSQFQLEGKLQLDHFSVLGIAWNTDLVDEAPETYEDLLRPEFADGRIGIPDPLTPAIADNYAFFEDTYGDDFLERLSEQEPRVYSTAVPIQEALITGEISITMFGASSIAWPARDEGAPIDFVVPDPGWAPPGMSYLPSWAQNPNAAQVLFDYLASPEGQEVLARDSIVPMPVEDPVVDIEQIQPLDVARVTETGWLDEFYDRWTDLYR